VTQGETPVTITVGDTAMTGRLNSTVMARHLADRLPMTVDKGNHGIGCGDYPTKVHKIEPPLPAEGTDLGGQPGVGEIAHYVPNGSLGFYYGQLEIFAVNLLAPYVLTALIPAPRLVYLSSSMHRVPPRLDDPFWRNRDWNGSRAYSESKLYVTALALAVARLRPNVFSNAVDPGWVPTRMGGPGAPDDLQEGAATQAGLAAGDSQQLSGLTGRYLHHGSDLRPDARTETVELQDQVLALGKSLSGLDL
jgi:hypothetical protein